MSNKFTIYAVDFDGTLCEDKFPNIGSPNDALISRLVKCREAGDKVVLWTCRCGQLLQNAVNWCKQHSLEFDSINENLPEVLEWFGGVESRKIHADIFIDDKAVNKPEYCVPYVGGQDAV